jgi:7,8-dihydroneopterin aldolase/epimerase/oxygenase
MDAILIRELRVDALIGIHRRERHFMQTLSIDVDIGLPGEAVFASDKVADTIDYEKVVLRIRELAASGQFRLVETFLERVAAVLRGEFGAPWVRVSAAKLGVLPNTRSVGVVIERGQR